jgi:hypothetical protein
MISRRDLKKIVAVMMTVISLVILCQAEVPRWSNSRIKISSCTQKQAATIVVSQLTKLKLPNVAKNDDGYITGYTPDCMVMIFIVDKGSSRAGIIVATGNGADEWVAKIRTALSKVQIIDCE